MWVLRAKWALLSSKANHQNAGGQGGWRSASIFLQSPLAWFAFLIAMKRSVGWIT
jgi:hypothetical protein